MLSESTCTFQIKYLWYKIIFYNFSSLFSLSFYFYFSRHAGKICNKPLLKYERNFPNQVFSGKGSSGYQNARFSGSGWCAPIFGTYLLLDLQKEYHITHVAILGNRDQTMWSSSYAMQYSHAETLVHGSSAKPVFVEVIFKILRI